MSGKMREPLFRDRIFGEGNERYHVAVQICEYNELDVFLTIWPVYADSKARTVDFPLDMWEGVRTLIDNAIKDWNGSDKGEGDG